MERSGVLWDLACLWEDCSYYIHGGLTKRFDETIKHTHARNARKTLRHQRDAVSHVFKHYVHLSETDLTALIEKEIEMTARAQVISSAWTCISSGVRANNRDKEQTYRAELQGLGLEHQQYHALREVEQQSNKATIDRSVHIARLRALEMLEEFVRDGRRHDDIELSENAGRQHDRLASNEEVIAFVWPRKRELLTRLSTEVSADPLAMAWMQNLHETAEEWTQKIERVHDRLDVIQDDELETISGPVRCQLKKDIKLLIMDMREMLEKIRREIRMYSNDGNGFLVVKVLRLSERDARDVMYLIFQAYFRMQQYFPYAEY